MQTPMADPDRALTGRGSQRTTPSKSAKARSRVAGALRADTEIGDGELSNIDEAEEVEVSRVMPSMTVSRTCLAEGHLLMLVQSQRPPASVPSHHASQQSISHHTPHGAGFQRYAPSMPPMRPRPMVSSPTYPMMCRAPAHAASLVCPPRSAASRARSLITTPARTDSTSRRCTAATSPQRSRTDFPSPSRRTTFPALTPSSSRLDSPRRR
jgi:hypothetical protein